MTVLSGVTVYAQVGADRVAVTGLVTDPSGAAVPDATVTLINNDTGVKTVIATNGAGNFTTPALILGNYTLQVSKQGFKLYSQPGLSLTIGGHIYTQNLTLQLGATTTTVEVKASAQLINTQSPQINYQISQSQYKDLPDVMGADIRLAETKLILSPGYVPTAPNGDAIFRGDAFQSRINGGQTVSWESWFDGAEYGYAEGHQQTHESSIPYSAVQEMTTTVNNFSAQYGHTSGGIALYTTKSGTNRLHGSVYDILTSNKLDAANFFFNTSTPALQKFPLTQNNAGFAVGGPIPKITKWGKTFWFTNFDRFDYHSTVAIGYQNRLPTPAERKGDFSELLTDPASTCANPTPTNPCQAGTDALGRPIYYGEIFNPATTRTVGGIPVRDGYGFDPTTGLPIAGQANIIPADDPLLVGNPGGQTVAGIIPGLDRNTLFSPNEIGGTSDDNDKINVWTWLLRVDHTFNDKWSASLTYFQNHRPRTAHCGGPGGCNTLHNGQTDSKANDTYVGQGFYQLITNHFAHLQLNWVIKPNLFNHATIAYDRWVMNGHQLSSGVGWNQKLGLGLPNLPAFNGAGFPTLNFYNGPTNGYTNYGTPWLADGSDINNRYQFYDDLTWIIGRHTVKMGVQSNYITFPQTGWAVNSGGQFNFVAQSTAGYDATGTNLANANKEGDAFAAFLLGQVDFAQFNIFAPYMPKMSYVAPWIQDSFKITDKLTLDYGLRLDHNSGVSEQHNRFSTFVPTATQTIGGATVNGATVFGPVANGNGSTGVAPRFGFAYMLGKNSVIRGGYGLYYGATLADSWDPYPVDGYTTNPTVANTTNDLYPSFYFNSTCPAAVQTEAANNGVTIPCSWPAGSITFPPNLTPGVKNGGAPVAVSPNNYEMPIWQNWSISFQHQWGSNISLDVAYVGNHGTRLPDDRASAGLLFNMNSASVLQYGSDLQNAGFTNGVPYGDVHGIAAPWPTFTGNLAHALLPFPQYNPQGILWRKTHNGKSHYNSLQIQFVKHGENNSTTIAYTWSKLMNNGAESGQEGFLPVQNPSDMSDMWGPSGDDVPQVLTIGEVYTLPFGKGQKFASGATGVLDKLIDGWKLSGIASYESGRPQTMYTANNLYNYLFNVSQFPNIVTGQNPLTGGAYSNPFTQSYYNKNAFSNPAQFTFGNSPRTRNGVRGFPYYNEDVSIYKDTYFGENRYVRFEAEGGNIFNRVDFCNPDSNINDTTFGHTYTQCNVPRRIQLGLEIFF